MLSLHNQLVVDGWMAIVSGRWIVQHGLPSHDTLTVFAHGHRWIDQQWLAQLGLYGLWRLGGVKLALFVHALLVTSGLVGAALFARTRGATARSVTWIAIPVLIAYYPVASVMRPQSFAFPLFAAVLWLVLADARQPSRRVFWTLPLLVLWTNLHGSVVLGAMLVSLAGLVGMVRAAAAERTRARAPARAVGLRVRLALRPSPARVLREDPRRRRLQAVRDGVGADDAHPADGGRLPGRARRALAARPGRAAALPLLDQLAFALTAVLAFEAVRNTAWIGLVALAVLPPTRRPAAREPGGGAGAPEPDPLRHDPRHARDLGRRRGGEADELVHDRVPDRGGAGRVEPQPDRTDACTPRAPTPTGCSGAGPTSTGRVAYDARFELLSQAQLKRIARFQARVGNWLPTARGYRVFVLDPRSDHALERSLLRALPARVVFSSPQVVVLRRRG